MQYLRVASILFGDEGGVVAISDASSELFSSVLVLLTEVFFSSVAVNPSSLMDDTSSWEATMVLEGTFTCGKTYIISNFVYNFSFASRAC